MTDTTLISSGVILLIVLTIAFGGTFLLQVSTGGVPTNDLQKSFFRAGHAHAGVLVILGLLIRLFVADPRVPEWSRLLGDGVLYAAVLMSAGFFLSVAGRDPQRAVGGRGQFGGRAGRRLRRTDCRRARRLTDHPQAGGSDADRAPRLATTTNTIAPTTTPA